MSTFRGQAPPDELIVVRVHTPLRVTVGEHEIDLGWVRIFYYGARPGAVTRFEDRDEIALEPTETSQIVMHWVPDPSAPESPGPEETPIPG